MKLSISNLAWEQEHEAEVLSLLKALGVGGIEVAPTKVFPDWKMQDSGFGIQDSGFKIPAFQSILFGKPELQLFGGDESRTALLGHIELVAKLANEIGAKVLVFGAPKNRQKGDMDSDKAFGIAAEFFSGAGDVCAGYGVTLCIEPNPAMYACDFVNTADEGAKLVRTVASKGFGLHLDAACMYLSGDDPLSAIGDNIDILKHFHISEVGLKDFSAQEVDHHKVANALRSAGYVGWISIEMLPSADPVKSVREAIKFAKEVYLDA